MTHARPLLSADVRPLMHQVGPLVDALYPRGSNLLSRRLDEVLSGSFLTVVAVLLILPPGTLLNSTAAVFVQHSILLVTTITAATILAAARLLVALSSKWSRVKDIRRWLSLKLYRIH